MSAISAAGSDLFAFAQAARAGAAKGKSSGTSTAKTSDGKPLSTEQQKQVDDLKKRDTEVREHEAAHLASAGGYARGGASFDYQVGPDGHQYAVGGHVDIDASPVKGDPRATIAKAQIVERAALAPADPSSQDRAVAAEAAQQAAAAQQEINQQKQGDATTASSPKGSQTARAAAGYAKSGNHADSAGATVNVIA